MNSFKQQSSQGAAVEHNGQPSNLISAVCLSNLSYSLINVSAVATTAVCLNARLNVFMKWGVWICLQALSSVRLLALIISQRASPSLRLSLSLGDMISTAPHQSASAVICPTFNVNMRGCHGEAGRAARSCPLSFLSSSLSGINVTQYSAFHHSACQRYTILTYYLCQSNTPEPTFLESSGFKKWIQEMLHQEEPQWKSPCSC